MFVNTPCPTCTRVYTTGTWTKIAGVARACLGFLMLSRGRGGLEMVKELNLRRDLPSGVLDIVKSRMLGGLRLWLQKGWLSRQEVMGVIDSLDAEDDGVTFVVTTERRSGFRPVKSASGWVDVAEPPKIPTNRSLEMVEF